MTTWLTILKRLSLAVSVVTLSFLLSACGGGSSSGSEIPDRPPAPQNFALSPQPTKTFAFTWSDGARETTYRLFESPAMGEGLTEIATLDANAESYELAVSLPARINASYILQACNAGGCTNSDTVFVEGTLKEAVGYFKASNTGDSDYFGYSIALDGDTLVVGARLEDSSSTGVNGNESDDATVNAGAVYVFVRDSNGVWLKQAYLKASNADSDDNFGRAVALSGDSIAVGSPYEDSGATGVNGNQADESERSSGAVYIFSRAGTTWSQQAYLKAFAGGTNDTFGRSLALDGDILVVGAPQEDSNAVGVNGDQLNDSAPYSGAAYAFRRSSNNWTQEAYLKASNSEQNDYFGWSVAVSGETIVVGAPDEGSGTVGVNGNQADNSLSESGAAYVFVRNAMQWSQQAYLKASNPGELDYFGLSVSIDTDTLVVGANNEDSIATGVNGNQADNTSSNSGAAYVFVRNASAWSQQAYLKASQTGANDEFGYSVAVSGNTVLIGAPSEANSAIGINGAVTGNAPFSGATYSFVRDGTVWAQQGYLKAPNAEQRDFFGWAVALTGDTAAISGPDEESNATGVNGNRSNNTISNSGAVYLY